MKKRYKILVADDSPLVLSSVQQMLVDENYLVLKAEDGRQACTIAYNERPDLILIDIEMPVMNGAEAICKIKSNNKIKDIPIIVISSAKRFDETIIVGANDFLIKPFNKFELFLRIQLNLDAASKAKEIKKHHELIKAQRQEALQQHDTIKKQQTELFEDLRYASHIQRAIFPETNSFEELFSSFFIFNKPKNIVSGDFFWLSRKNDFLIFAVGDCTGHGISGALMTMAGTAFLNEIVNSNNQTEPEKILNDLRIRVIKLLHQKGIIGEASDGMDLSLCVYNKATGKMKFSGANSVIYIVQGNNNFVTLKGDRMPIGIHINHESDFSCHEININSEDTLYLFTDGFPDQFGGPLGQKFRYHQFQKLVQQDSLLPLSEQFDLFDKSLSEWKGDFEQVDDILVIGLKV